MFNYNRKLKEYAQDLRKNMTNAERLLWSKVKRKQVKNTHFYRQKTIGNYIVDFYCPKLKLAIEIDGGQHFTENGKEKDKIRDDNIKKLGIKVIRISDTEIFKNIDGVMERIYVEFSP